MLEARSGWTQALGREDAFRGRDNARVSGLQPSEQVLVCKIEPRSLLKALL